MQDSYITIIKSSEPTTFFHNILCLSEAKGMEINMKHKLMITIMVCSVVVITGAIITTKTTGPLEKIVISADYPKYDTLENLVDRTDTIVKGKIIDFKYSELNITQEVNTDDQHVNPIS